MTRRERRRLLAASYVLAAVGIAALAYCAVVWWTGRIYQEKAERQFESELHKAVPQAAAPPAMPPNGAVIGRLEIPRLHLSVMVVEGDTDRDLRHAAGHIPGTALPGQPGNLAIAGHRDTYFRPLRAIRPDDAIVLRTVQGAYRYRVVSTKVVGPRDVAVLRPAAHDELTLVTCFPFYYVGAAPKRFIVQAERSGA